MGTKKAAMAVAHKILVAIFHRLQHGIGFVDLGGNYLDGINKHRTAKRLVRRLNLRGYEVMLRPQAAA
jgi:transposase